MRPRRGVVIVAAIAVLAGVLWIAGNRIISHDRALERFLTKTLSDVSGSSVSIARVRIGFLSLHLKNVRIVFPTGGAEVGVRDIRVAFSLSRLVRNKFDFSRSIANITLIGPRITILLRPQFRLKIPTGSLHMEMLRAWSLDHIDLRRGAIALVKSDQADTTVLLSSIAGRIWGDASALYFDSRGSFQAGRDNVELSGVLSSAGENNQVRLKISDAAVDRPLALGGINLTKGKLDASVECSFPESLTVRTFEAHGSAALAGAGIRIGTDGPSLDSLDGSVSLIDAKAIIDSLSGVFRGSRLRARAQWDFAGRQVCTLAVALQHVRPDSFGVTLAPLITARGDSAWARLQVYALNASAPQRMLFSAGGLSVSGQPLKTASGLAHLDSSRLVIDSFTAIGRSVALRTHGFVRMDTDSAPEFSISFAGTLDTLPLLPEVQGHVRVGGWVERRSTLLRGAATLAVSALRVGTLSLGEQRLTLSLDKGAVNLETPSQAGQLLALSGRIDSVLTGRPRLQAALSTALPLSMLVPPGTKIPFVNSNDSLKLAGSVAGVWPLVGFDGRVQSVATTLKGSCRLNLARTDTAGGALSWALTALDLTCADNAFPLGGRGTLKDATLFIDTAWLAGGVRCSGRIPLDSAAALALSVSTSAYPLATLNQWFFQDESPLSEGLVSGALHLSGRRASPQVRSELHFRNVKALALDHMETDLFITGTSTLLQVAPFRITRNGGHLAGFDTLLISRDVLQVNGRFGPLPLAALLPALDTASQRIEGTVEGIVYPAANGNGLLVKAHVLRPRVAGWSVDSIAATLLLDKKGLALQALSATDSMRSKFDVSGHADWALVTGNAGEQDSLEFSAVGRGDLLATLCKGLNGPGAKKAVAGSGQGLVQLQAVYTDDQWFFRKGMAAITGGTLQVPGIVPGRIKNVSFTCAVNETGAVALELRGALNKGTFRLVNTHDFKKPFEPFRAGPLDLGVLQMQTSPGGIDVHLPGFMQNSQTVSVECLGKKPLKEFTIGGPLEAVLLSGTLVLRNTEFTFPLMIEAPVKGGERAGEEDEGVAVGEDLLASIRWNIDIIPGNPNLKYFRDIGMNQQQRLIRFFQAYLDPGSILMVRGQERAKTLKLEGSLRSNKGSIYYGRIFDRNFEVGLDFVPVPNTNKTPGYNNLPILWGSAEAFADTSRLHRVKLTALIYDPATGAMAHKGRMALFPFALAQKIKGGGLDLLSRLLQRPHQEKSDSIMNLDFQLTSDLADNMTDIQAQAYKDFGGKIASVQGASEVISGFGEQFIHNFYLQQVENRLARLLGVDVLGVETSIASNYFNKFYNRQSLESESRWGLLENTGVTVGRYFFHDYLLLKAGSSLVSVDTLLTPEYSVGLEVWPWRYLLMDFDYGIRQGVRSVEYNPRLNLQLQLPIGKMRKTLDF